jgi:hypothetical protein
MEVAYLNAQFLSILERTEANQAVPNLLTIRVAFSRQPNKAVQSLISPAKFKSHSGEPILCFFTVFPVQEKIGTLCEIRIRPLISTSRSIHYLLIMLPFDVVGGMLGGFRTVDKKIINTYTFRKLLFVHFQKHFGRTALFHSLSLFPAASVGRVISLCVRVNSEINRLNPSDYHTYHKV